MEEQSKGAEDLNLNEQDFDKYQAMLAYVNTIRSGYQIGSISFAKIPISKNYKSSSELGVVQLIKDNIATCVLIDFEFDRSGKVKGAKKVGEIGSDGELTIQDEYIRQQQEIIMKEQNKTESEVDELKEKYYLRNNDKGDLEAVPEDKDTVTQEKRKMQADLDNGLGEPLQIIKLSNKDAEKYSSLKVNINPDAGEVVLVKYPSDVLKGNWITAQKIDGKYVQVAGREVAELNQNIADALDVIRNREYDETGRNNLEALKFDDDAYADALYVGRIDTIDRSDIISQNGWGKSARSEIGKEKPELLELEGSEAIYPPETVAIRGRVVQVNSQEVEEKKEELINKCEEKGYPINDAIVKQIKEARTMNELANLEQEIEARGKNSRQPGGIEKVPWPEEG